MISRLLLIFSLLSIIFAYNERYGVELYQESQDARNAALGGWCASYIDGNNSSLLKFATNSAVHFSHKNKYAGLIDVTLFSYIRQGDKYPYYVSLTSRIIDGIDDTRYPIWNDYDGDDVPGSDEINYSEINQFSQQEIGFQLGTIRKMGSYTIGINLKPNLTSLAEFWSYGISGDVSILVEPSHRFWISLRAEDLINFKYWDSGRLETRVPLIIGSANFDFQNLKVGVETGLRLEENYLLNYHLGIEFIQQKYLFFRIGTSHDNQFTLGLGFQPSLIDFSYAYLHPDLESPFKASHILSIGINLGEIEHIKGKIKP